MSITTSITITEKDSKKALRRNLETVVYITTLALVSVLILVLVLVLNLSLSF